jgi:hypothetical protein
MTSSQWPHVYIFHKTLLVPLVFSLEGRTEATFGLPALCTYLEVLNNGKCCLCVMHIWRLRSQATILIFQRAETDFNLQDHEGRRQNSSRFLTNG